MFRAPWQGRARWPGSQRQVDIRRPMLAMGARRVGHFMQSLFCSLPKSKPHRHRAVHREPLNPAQKRFNDHCPFCLPNTCLLKLPQERSKAALGRDLGDFWLILALFWLLFGVSGGLCLRVGILSGNCRGLGSSLAAFGLRFGVHFGVRFR